jgi:ribosomal-protein-alanine N-acetyltransferase
MEADPVNFAIVDSDEAIGSIGLTLQRGIRRRAAEVGFWIAEERWGEGIATTVVTAFAEFAFAQFDLLRLAAYVFEGNTASTRVLEKAGFTYEGTLRSSIVKDDHVVDELVYALVRPEE